MAGTPLRQTCLEGFSLLGAFAKRDKPGRDA